tara:strand:+ start:1581 stop:2303 length:723 start_codon:yes stop_codon:yes gene_type:complete
MGYFRELPNILYQSPLPNKISSADFIQIKNIFRGSKLFDYLKTNVSLFNKYIIEDGERPDIIAENLYGDSRLDYIVIIIAGITNIHHEWPIQDFQLYDFTLSKYGSEEKMNAVHHYETNEIKDSNGRQILPPNLIVDDEFKIDGSAVRFGTNRFTLISEQGNLQLDDKDEYTVKVDNIAIPVTNFEFEIGKNEDNRKIDVLRKGYVQTFINDFRDIVRYDENSGFLNSALAITENTNIIP